MAALCSAIDLLGLGLGAWLLFGRRTAFPTLVIWTLGFGTLATASVLLVTTSMFGLLRIACHLLFCVGAPLALIWGALRWKRGPHRWVGAVLVVIALGMEGAYYYARRIEPFDLKVRRHT